MRMGDYCSGRCPALLPHSLLVLCWLAAEAETAEIARLRQILPFLPSLQAAFRPLRLSSTIAKVFRPLAAVMRAMSGR